MLSNDERLKNLTCRTSESEYLASRITACSGTKEYSKPFLLLQSPVPQPPGVFASLLVLAAQGPPLPIGSHQG